MVTVTISVESFEHAQTLGHKVTRDTEQRIEPSMVNKEPTRGRLINNIGSIVAEMAVAQYLNRRWLGDEYNGPAGFDVEPNIEVRTTDPKLGLYIKHREVTKTPHEKPPSANYVLTWFTQNNRTVHLVGFMRLDYALSASKPHKHNGKTMGYIVDHDSLWPIERLYDTLN